MEEEEFLKDFEGIKDYRTFLVGLDKKFKSVGLLYREFKILEDMASSALKIAPMLHDFVSHNRVPFTASYKLKLTPWQIVSSEEKFVSLKTRT